MRFFNFNYSVASARTKKYSKSVFYSFFLQIVGVFLSLIIFPLTVNFLGVEEFGLWTTINNLIVFLTMLDFGLSHGLRNKYAEAKALENFELMKKYVSSAFFSLIIISSIIVILFLFAYHYINWISFFNAPIVLKKEVEILVFCLVLTFCIRLVFGIINSILFAEQNAYAPLMSTVLGNLFSVVALYLLPQFAEPNLISCGIILFTCQTIPIIFFFFYFLIFKYPNVFPSYDYFSLETSKRIVNLGLKFFFIQITALILFQSNNLIIAHTSNYEDVAKFNIAFKYLGVLQLGFSTILAPLWSACTDAYYKKDYNWIERVVRKLNILWLIFAVIGVILIFSSSFWYEVWLGDSIVAEYGILAFLLLYFLFLMRVSIFRSFMNGVGKIRLQIYVTLIQAVFHIPLAYVFGKSLGVKGVILVMFIWVFVNSIWERIQFNKIISDKAVGIWNK